ncbi:MAG TPA: hypothetical protein VMT88_12175 [Actinomycetes bacterium]|nr:hypothetical protein [Actinomycetes bacterium]
MAGPELDAALFDEVVAKADLVWVVVAGHPARGLWHVWHDGAVAVVTDGREQPNPGLADGQLVDIIARSKATLNRVATAAATTELLDPHTDAWSAAAQALHPKRLNATDGEGQPERWKRESSIWLLRPTGTYSEGPGHSSDQSHRAEPLLTAATTDNQRPFHFGRATRKRR